MWETGKRFMLGAFHPATCSGSGVQFLVILCIPSSKEGDKLVDGEFAAKVSCKYGRNSDLAVAREFEVLTIINARGAREEPLFDGIWNVQARTGPCCAT